MTRKPTIRLLFFFGLGTDVTMEAEKPLTLEQVMDRLPMSDTATALSKRIDMRRRRAYVLASSIMQELQHLIPDANHREAYELRSEYGTRRIKGRKGCCKTRGTRD